MSGGAYEYQQDRIRYIAERIQEEIELNNTPCEDMFCGEWNGQRYSDETIAKFKEGLEILRKAYVYAKRIDWLLSGDDGEETFRKRLKEDLENFKFEE